jgi:hypothetical protein
MVIPQHVWTWTEELPALIGLLGVIVALVANGWLARAQERDRLEQKSTALRIALTEELKVSLMSYKGAIEKLEAAEGDGSTSILVRTQCFTSVYEEMLDQIGLLAPGEVEAVMRAYLMIQQMPGTIGLMIWAETGELRAPSPDWLKVPKAKFDPVSRLNKIMVEIVEKAIAALSTTPKRLRASQHTN